MSNPSDLDSNDRKIHAERDHFISSLRDDDILALTALYHPNDARGCFFREPIRGSYNICYFIHFPSPSEGALNSNDDDADDGGERWVVRVPLQPTLGFDAKEKVETEVATMRYDSYARF